MLSLCLNLSPSPSDEIAQVTKRKELMPLALSAFGGWLAAPASMGTCTFVFESKNLGSGPRSEVSWERH